MCSKELRKGFAPSYFSVEDIMASQARIPCRTDVGIKNFGFLDPSQESEDLAPHTSVELPLWAARAMSKQPRNFVTVKLPKHYSEKFGEVLKADPVVVDLNKLGPQFYQTGLQLCTLPTDDTEFISEVLPDVLQKRLVAINDSYSLNRELKSMDASTHMEIGKMLRQNYMDPVETRIYNDSKLASELLDKWLRS